MTYDYEEDRMDREVRHFDWVPVNDKRMVMLRALRDTCKDCVMCELGRNFKAVHGQRIDPHVFSTMSPSRFLVVGQNPGFNECVKDEPFVGDAGKNFDNEVAKHGLTRKDFYITNIVKCHTDNNAAPSTETVRRCQLFLHMELHIMAPKFIVTLGAVSFGHFCPQAVYQKALGKMTYSDVIDKKVFAIYHPSPRNLSVESRRTAFEKQVGMLCKLVTFFSQTE
jgi:DNA polymerase